jgi:heterotetrameric sarcosine oxidase gamma subunit
MTEPRKIRVMLSALEQTGVDEREFGNASLTISELCGVSVVRLHTLQQPIAETVTFGLELPGRTGQCAGDDPAVLCIRPSEWLLISETADAAALALQALNGAPDEISSVRDNSDGLALFRLSGEAAPWLLSKLGGLDYLQGASSGAHCTRTKMGHIAVIVYFHQTRKDGWVFDLLLERSVAKYFWELLIQSAPHAHDLAAEFRTTLP